MWNDIDLDAATYTSMHDYESKQFLNYGFMEIQGSAYQGPYLMTPSVPYGSMGPGAGLASLGHGVHVPMKRFKIEYGGPDFPNPNYGDKTVLHRFTNGDL